MEKAILGSMPAITTSFSSHTQTPSLQFQLLPSSLTLPTLRSSLPFRFSSPSLSYPILSHSPLHRPLSTNCSIVDGSIPNSTTKVASTDPSLAVKKKAADISPELKGTSVFLVGMKCSLKTSLGKLLAETLRYYYFDSDNLVEEATGGASAAQSFRESDEEGFRESEALVDRLWLSSTPLKGCGQDKLTSFSYQRCLGFNVEASGYVKTEVLKQLSSMGRLVVCAGNGAVQSSTNLGLLRHGISLWIDVPLGMVARDVIKDQSEFVSFEIPTTGSHSQSDIMIQLGALHKKYRDGYATADAIISLQKVASRLGCDNLDEITREDMTLEALQEIEKLTRMKKMMEEAATPF